MKNNKDQNWIQTKETIKKQRERLINEFKHIKKRSMFNKRNQNDVVMIGQKTARLKTEVDQKSLEDDDNPNMFVNQESEHSSLFQNQTYRGSQNSLGRLSKLSEEEASSIFAKRRKELLGKLILQRENHQQRRRKRKQRKKIGPTLKKKLKATNGNVPSPERKRMQPNFVIFSGQTNHMWHRKKHREAKQKKEEKSLRVKSPQIKLIEVFKPDHFPAKAFAEINQKNKAKIISSSVLDLPEPANYDLVPQQQDKNPSRHHSDVGIIHLEEEKRSKYEIESLQRIEVKQPNQIIYTKQVDRAILQNKQRQHITIKLIEQTREKRQKATQKFFNHRNKTEPKIAAFTLKYTKRQRDIIQSRKSPRNKVQNSYFKRKQNKDQGKYLFDQAKIYQAHKQKLKQEQTKKKFTIQSKQCTFRPQINEESQFLNVFKKHKKIWQRAKEINQEKKIKRKERQKKQLHDQLRKCTFSPNLNRKSQKLAQSLDNDFYIRSMKWKKRREEDKHQKQEKRKKQFKKYIRSKTPRIKNKSNQTRKKSVIVQKQQYYAPTNYKKRSNSSSNVQSPFGKYNQGVLEQIQQKKRFLEMEKKILERQITQRHRNRSKSQSRSRHKRSKHSQSKTTRLNKTKLKSSSKISEISGGDAYYDFGYSLDLDAGPDLTLDENSPEVQLTSEVNYNHPTSNLAKDFFDNFDLRKSKRKKQKLEMEDLFDQQVSNTLSIFEKMGNFLKSEDLSKPTPKPKVELSPKRAKNLSQMAFIISKTSSVLKGKKHMKTPSIQDIPPVYQSNSPFVNIEIIKKKKEIKPKKFLKQKEEYQNLLQKANKINNRIRMSRDSRDSLYTKFYE